MKITLLVALGFVAALSYALRSRRAARVAEAEAADARAKAAAARRDRIPTVSSNLKGASNLKGVTATQAVEPFHVADEQDD